MVSVPRQVQNEDLLAEIEDILRAMPSLDAFGRGSLEPLSWVGRALAAIQRWNPVYMLPSNQAAKLLRGIYVDDIGAGYTEMHTLLCMARSDLRMVVGPLSVVVQAGQVFDYFDELRKVIETARTELFFVDPYIDPDFVSRYLPHAASGVTVRLLGNKGMPALVAAVDMFAKQSGLTIQVRSSSGLHDRFLFIDKSSCYLSGASFKDGGKKAPAAFTQITDAFPAMLSTYENLWTPARVER